MLIRNCALELFQQGDRNVRTTVFDCNPRYYVPEAYKIRWIETIKDSFGKGLLNSSVLKSFCIRKPKQKNAYLYSGTFSDLIQKIDSMFQKPTPIRIDILGDKQHTWIILFPEFNAK